MRNIRFSPEAGQDLAEAADYLDRESGNPDFGDQLNDDFDHLTDLIAQNPLMGRERPELQKGLRGFPHGSSAIFWRLNDDHVEIVRAFSTSGRMWSGSSGSSDSDQSSSLVMNSRSSGA